jgi:hypothetical protein
MPSRIEDAGTLKEVGKAVLEKFSVTTVERWAIMPGNALSGTAVLVGTTTMVKVRNRSLQTRHTLEMKGLDITRSHWKTKIKWQR